MTAPPLTALYVPGDRPDRFTKATGSGADIVIIDLEDSVAPARKEQARDAAVRFLADMPPCPVLVRVNAADTPWHSADLAAIGACAHLSGVRLPKVGTAAEAEAVAQSVAPRPVHAVIESAAGVENLFTIARAPGVVSISLGEADLRSDLSITDPDALAWIRGRAVVAARSAGLAAPMMSVWTDLHDGEGLAASCRHGKAQGFLGRAAIHPTQLRVIRAAFAPTPAELTHAHQVLAALNTAGQSDSGVAVLDNGQMVDAAMRRAAERTVALADGAKAP